MSLWDEALVALDDVFFENRIPAKYNVFADGVFRNLRRIDYAIKRTKKHRFHLPEGLKNILRIGVYLAAIDREYSTELAVNTAVEKAKEKSFHKQVGFVNAVLRRISENWKEISSPSSSNYPAYLAILHSYPDYIVQRWLGRFGRKRTEKLLADGNKKAANYFRINTSILTTDEFYDMLQKDEIEFTKHPHLNNFFKIDGGELRTSEWQHLKDGLVFVQDPAFEAATIALDPRRGQRILEIGCAPGGKLTRIAELVGAKSEIVGVDFSEKRLDRTYENIGKIGKIETQDIKLYCADGRDFNPDEKFDRVLVDPPCSSFGVIRRHPEIKWLRKEVDLKRIAALQKNIAENSMQLVKPGGLLVWSTCTTETKENADIVNHILSFDKFEVLRFRHPAFNVYSVGPFVQTFPPDYDGAFIAILRRKDK